MKGVLEYVSKEERKGGGGDGRKEGVGKRKCRSPLGAASPDSESEVGQEEGSSLRGLCRDRQERKV